MALSLQSLIDAPIIELDTIDSTNNYAMRLIDADTAQPGMTITANEQTQGKGQRGKVWTDSKAESLIMSLVTMPNRGISNQFMFNVCTTVAIADVLQSLYEGWDVRIKWPNDIIINDKKAGGVLIENVIRGNNWVYSIIGIGMNILQGQMPDELPYAVSLKSESGKDYDIKKLMHLLRVNILENIYDEAAEEELLSQYNEYLFRQGQMQKFEDDTEEWEAEVMAATRDGQLAVRETNGTTSFYTHGVVNWKW